MTQKVKNDRNFISQKQMAKPTDSGGRRLRLAYKKQINVCNMLSLSLNNRMTDKLITSPASDSLPITGFEPYATPGDRSEGNEGKHAKVSPADTYVCVYHNYARQTSFRISPHAH